MWIEKQRLKNWTLPVAGLLYAIGMTTAVLSMERAKQNALSEGKGTRRKL